tara:strand:+ start:103 stop:885 length:783 start_codon:yes stop_codon:yes gene_type:complete
LKNPLVTILIANYNNEKFISECINSLKEQTYKNIEIIFFDDYSQDRSLEEIKKFENIKIIQNREKTKIGSFNQANAYKKAFELSNGEIILFLDSDDYFANNKIKEVVQFYNNNKNAKIIFDLPLIKKGNNITNIKITKKIFNKLWPYIYPTSCISIKRNYFKKIFKVIYTKKFPDIWIDFRITIYSKYILHELYLLNKNLTYYRQSNNNISSKFKHLSANWWKRRLQAHKYLKSFLIGSNIKYRKNLDYYITNIYNKFID